MTAQGTQREARRLKEVAREYRQKGYEVFVGPGPEQTPEFLRPFRPDMIARKGAEWIVVEVKTRASLAAYRQMDKLAEVVALQPSWKLHLVVVNPREKPGHQSLSVKEVLALLERAERLLGSQEREAAALLAASAMEALIHHVAKTYKIPLRGKTFLHNAKHLVAYGALEEQDFATMEPLYHFRNSLTHGFKPEQISDQALGNAIRRIAEIAKEAKVRKVA